MKLETDSPRRFRGKVRYSGVSSGAVAWKSGAMMFTREVDGDWKLDLLYDTSCGRPVLSLKLCSSRISRVVNKETGFILEYKKGSELLTVSFRSSNEQRSVTRPIQMIMDEVKLGKTDVSASKCEVAAAKKSTPLKSPLWTSTNLATKDEPRDTSPQRFTSVKENKKCDQRVVDLCDSDEKENLGSPNGGGNKFLQQSAEKSRSCLSFYGKQTNTSQPLYNSTPNSSWLNSKRQPGMMPDPTPVKRARLSDSIPYSMKAKPQQQSNQKQAPVLQGFSNLGNTCYMNSILQSLFCLDTFSTDLTTNKKLLKALQPQSLYHALARLLHVKALQSTDETRRTCLKRVKSAISNTAKRFLGYGQHDAHEFLGQVLDQLKEEVIKVSKCTPSPSPANKDSPDIPSPEIIQGLAANPIIKNFEFEVVHSLDCLNCGERVMKAEQFHDISLDLPKHKDQFTPRSLQDALSLFFKNEEIEYACEKCSHNKSFVTHKLTRLPRVFILHLKRYLYNQTFSRNTKMGQNVAIPQYITLDNHCTEHTQPAYPPTLIHPSTSEQKAGSDLDDSKDDAPSRRRLEYPGFKFSRKGLDSSFVKEGESTSENGEKRDEVDGSEPRPLTLEDEEDSDLTRAIEMSLREKEEQDKIARDFGDDTEENYERVMEMSRRDNEDDLPDIKKKDLKEDLPDIKKKDLKELSEEEMIQLAIEQSLQEAHYSHTQTDDVMDTGPHFTQIDDVTENGHHNYTRSSDTGHSSESYDINPDWQPTRERGQAFVKTYSVKKPVVSVKEKPVRTTETSDSLLCSETLSEDNDDSADSCKLKADTDIGLFGDENDANDKIFTDVASPICGKDDSESSSQENVELFVKTETDNSVSTETKMESHWSERLKDLEGKFSSDDTGNSETDIENDVKTRNIKSSEDLRTQHHKPVYKVQKPVYEVFSKQHGEMGCDNGDSCSSDSGVIDLTEASSRHKDTKTHDHNDNITQDHKNNITHNNCDNKTRDKPAQTHTVDANDKTQTAEAVNASMETQDLVERKCQLTNKGDNSGLTNKGDNSGMVKKEEKGTGDHFIFDCDEDEEDNSWLFLADKENTLPANTNNTEKPRLSSPAQFQQDTDTSLADEVDGYVEKNIDLPEIKNEKGDLPYSYKLVSIVNHMGLSTSTGHYLSDVYDMKKKSWYSYDDSHVTKMTQDDVLAKRERSGYIFFYMSKDIFDDVALHNDVVLTDRKSNLT